MLAGGDHASDPYSPVDVSGNTWFNSATGIANMAKNTPLGY